jgi:hypothetical protein
MSPLAKAAYDILLRRIDRDDPRISYAELARELRDVSEEFEFVYHRSRELYAALTEIGMECRRLKLPPLPALVVRADTRRPGDAYFAGGSGGAYKDDRIAAWEKDFEAVKTAKYPPQ